MDSEFQDTLNYLPNGGTKQLDASVLACFRESDGQLLYRYVSPRLPQGRVHDWPNSSMACSPFVEKDRLWFLSNRAEVVCLDISPLLAETGEPKLLWKVDLIGEHGVFPRGSRMTLMRLCSVAGYKEFIYVITGHGTDEGDTRVTKPDAPSLICFHKDTGKVVWQDASPGSNILDGQWSSPTIIEINGQAQCVTPQGDGWLRSFDALTGELIWKFDINRKVDKWELGGRSRRNNIVSSPVFAGNRIFIASGMYVERGEGLGRLVCIDPTKRGDISVELAVDSDGNSVPPRRIQAIDTTRGEKAIPNPNTGLVWEFTHVGDGKKFENAMHHMAANVTVDKGLVIAADGSGLVHCLDAATGQRYWAYDVLAAVFGSPLIVDGKVYVGDEDGDVAIFELSPDPEVALRYVKAEDQTPSAEVSVYCTPVFANGVLYIAAQDRLYAFAADQTDPKPATRPGISTTPNKTREDRPARGAFVPTPHDIVRQMLQLANVQKNDTVCDLGSGDGRIVIAAAKEFGCKAIGYEINAELVTASLQHAKSAGVEQLVTFEREDLFNADLTHVDVVTLYLLRPQNEKLIPQLKKMKPGSRIVCHHFEIPGVTPERMIAVESKETGEKHFLYLYRLPWPQSEAD